MQDFLTKGQRSFQLSPQFSFDAPLGINWSRDKSTLSEVRDFFQGPNDVTVLSHVLDAQLMPAFQDALQHYNSRKCAEGFTNKPVPCSRIQKGFTLSAINLSLRKEPDATLGSITSVYRTLLRAPDNDCSIEFIFSRDFGSGSKEVAIADKQTICTAFEASQGKFALDWLRSMPPQTRLLTGVEQGNVEVFFKAKAVWDQIAGMTPPDASRFLDDKLRSSRQTVSVIGLSVDERLVTVIAPPVVIAI